MQTLKPCFWWGFLLLSVFGISYTPNNDNGRNRDRRAEYSDTELIGYTVNDGSCESTNPVIKISS